MDEVYVVLEREWVSLGQNMPSVSVPTIAVICATQQLAEEYVESNEGDFVIARHEMDLY